MKHAKAHRSQIERDNAEVKALFSYLSHLYREGWTIGDDSSSSHKVPNKVPNFKKAPCYDVPDSIGEITTSNKLIESDQKVENMRNLDVKLDSLSSSFHHSGSMPLHLLLKDLPGSELLSTKIMQSSSFLEVMKYLE